MDESAPQPDAEAEPLPELTECERRFINEFLADPVAVAAYMRAFDCKVYGTAAVLASRLLKKDHIKAHLDASRRASAKQFGVSFNRALRKLAAVAFADPDALYEPDPENGGLPKPRPWADIPPAARKNIVSVKIKRRKLKGADDCLYELEELEYKMLDPMAALDKLCKYLGITKGSMTVDELRNLIYGPAAAANPPATQSGAPPVPADGVQPGSEPGTAGRAELDPDE